jgi:aldose 1-epimerase
MSFVKIQLDEQNYFEVNADQGACLSKLVLSGSDIIKFPLREDDPKKGYPSALLFPFPNRIKDGKYDYKGHTYQLPINEEEYGNAIHGLVAFERFTLKEKKQNSASFVYTYDGNKPGYPFPYIFEIKYTLNKAKLNLDIKIQNNGEITMPYGFAWHPYFGFQGSSIGEMSLKVPLRYRIELDEKYVPTGEKEIERKTLIPLKNTFLDNLYEIKKVGDIQELELRFKKKKVIVSQKTGINDFNYFIAYTPPNRDCIALEPQTMATNGFNNGQGIMELKAGKIKKFNICVRIENQ